MTTRAISRCQKAQTNSKGRRTPQSQMGGLQTRIHSLREEESTLQEELRQLRAAVHIYNEIIATLKARVSISERAVSLAAA